MDVRITGRRVRITEALRQYIGQKMDRLKRYGVRLGDVQVVIGVEKHRHLAEVVVKINGGTVQGRASSREMYGSIDQALTKIRRQIQKRKEKIHAHKVSAVIPASAYSRREFQSNSAGVTIVRLMPETMTIGEAVVRVHTASTSLVVFMNQAVSRVHLARRLESGTVEVIDILPTTEAAV